MVVFQRPSVHFNVWFKECTFNRHFNAIYWQHVGITGSKCAVLVEEDDLAQPRRISSEELDGSTRQLISKVFHPTAEESLLIIQFFICMVVKTSLYCLGSTTVFNFIWCGDVER